MQAYYGSRFSANMTRTPEGFLICHNVPLARTGVQKYLGSEVGLSNKQIMSVYRNEAEVFSRKTLASFEGKPVTDNHPAEFVLPETATGYLRGVCTNIRRGTGNENDLIIGDLVVYDAILISEIESGKREISAGYYCDYQPFKDGLEQVNILCNHIAIVDSGRAGPRVAIKDNDSILEKKRGKKMAKKKSEENILHRMLGVFAKDEDTTPEDIKEAADAIGDDPESETKSESESKKAEDSVKEMLKAVVKDAVSPLVARIDALEKSKSTDEEPDDLKKLEDELEAAAKSEDDDGNPPDEEEESVTVDPDKITDEDGTEEGEKKETADTAAALKVLRAMKPIICNMPPAERKQATDALRKELLGVTKTQTKETPREYEAFLKRKATDAAVKNDNGNFGRACAEMNPHKKGGK